MNLLELYLKIPFVEGVCCCWRSRLFLVTCEPVLPVILVFPHRAVSAVDSLRFGCIFMCEGTKKNKQQVLEIGTRAFPNPHTTCCHASHFKQGFELVLAQMGFSPMCLSIRKKVVSYLRLPSGSLRALRLPPPSKTDIPYPLFSPSRFGLN